jgi:hypothetical protein
MDMAVTSLNDVSEIHPTRVTHPKTPQCGWFRALIMNVALPVVTDEGHMNLGFGTRRGDWVTTYQQQMLLIQAFVFLLSTNARACSSRLGNAVGVLLGNRSMIPFTFLCPLAELQPKDCKHFADEKRVVWGEPLNQGLGVDILQRTSQLVSLLIVWRLPDVNCGKTRFRLLFVCCGQEFFLELFPLVGHVFATDSQGINVSLVFCSDTIPYLASVLVLQESNVPSNTINL